MASVRFTTNSIGTENGEIHLIGTENPVFRKQKFQN